jgi:uncharacterized damage-inducible protein DinB
MRTDTPTAWDERSVLTTMLDYARATVRAKCEGLEEGLSTRAPLPTSPLMTVNGLVSHLRWVEHYWLESRFLGGPDLGPWTDDDPDGELTLAPQIPLAQLLDEYDAQSARMRELVDAHALDEPAALALSDGRRPPLRWVLMHLIEETSRHNGHLDILRELADGTTGS